MRLAAASRPWLLIRPVFIWQIYGPNSLILAENGYEVRSPMSNE
jgi:hypothetical protein